MNLVEVTVFGDEDVPCLQVTSRAHARSAVAVTAVTAVAHVLRLLFLSLVVAFLCLV